MQRKCLAPENEIRGLLKVFGVKLPIRLRGGAFEEAVRGTIENDPALSHALLLMLEARLMLLETFPELDRRVRRSANQDAICISQAGDADVRATLYAAANAMLMRWVAWSSLKASGVRLMENEGKAAALVAVARRIAVLLHRMWIDATEFRFGSEAAA